MNKLSLDNVWKYCLQQWAYVTTQMGTYHGMCNEVSYHKHKFIKKNKNTLGLDGTPSNSCFFCEYAGQQQQHSLHGVKAVCFYCPLYLIDGSSCTDSPAYDIDPKGFYERLVRLNRIRLEREGKMDTDNYIMIEGKRIELSKESAKNLKEQFGEKELRLTTIGGGMKIGERSAGFPFIIGIKKGLTYSVRNEKFLNPHEYSVIALTRNGLTQLKNEINILLGDKNETE